MHFRRPVLLYIRREKKMSKTLLLNYDKTKEDNLDKASRVLSKKEKEDLTSDYSNCVIEGCLDHGMNRMVIPDLANYLPSHVCNKHRDDLLKRYYGKNIYEERRVFYQYPEIHSQD
jgi:hypothetical protein